MSEKVKSAKSAAVTHNRQSSVHELRRAFSSWEDLTVKDALLEIRLSFCNAFADFRSISHQLNSLSDLHDQLTKIGGPLPCKLSSSLSIDPLDSKLTDGDFVSALSRLRSPNPLQACADSLSLLKKINSLIVELTSRVDSLNAEIKSLKSGSEFDSSLRLRRLYKDTLLSLERRQSFVLDFFFASRNSAIESLSSVTSSLCDLFPAGSDAVRRSYLSNASPALKDFKAFDDNLSFGRVQSNTLFLPTI